jgi:anti-anti-sigma factor
VTTADVVVAGTAERVRTLAVTGEVDLSNVAGVEDRILDATSNDLLGLVLDLTGVDYLDSTGLKLLFTLAVRLEISQITLELIVAPGSSVQRVLEMTGVGESVSVRTSD